MALRDSLGSVFTDEDFADLFPTHGQPAYPPWRLALVTLLQFRENLSDRGAAEAVRDRIAWKYLLGMELTDSGFDGSVLCEFRKRLLDGGAEMRLLDKLLTCFQELGLFKKRECRNTNCITPRIPYGLSTGVHPRPGQRVYPADAARVGSSPGPG